MNEVTFEIDPDTRKGEIIKFIVFSGGGKNCKN